MTNAEIAAALEELGVLYELDGANKYRVLAYGTDAGSLQAIFDRIDRLEKSDIKVAAFHRYRELFPPVLLAAAACLAAGGLLLLSGLRVAPV